MAVLGIGLGTQEPHFTLVLNGEPLLTLSDNSAVFRSLLLWLQARAEGTLHCCKTVCTPCEYHMPTLLKHVVL